MELTNEQFLTPTHDRNSSENFQKFILELFEKNGILSDLRAYLRGHIVSVLKSAQGGSPPPCQKLFTQRLDLMYQAVNILIVEYLFKSEFNYSLSVFLSELPLSNMVFGLAKTIMRSTDLATLVGTEMKFTNEDVMTVLKHLSIQCDSVHVKRLLEMYKSEKLPLLICILKCIPLYDAKEVNVADDVSKGVSEISLSSLSSCNSDSKVSWCPRKDSCKHLFQCKLCQKLMSRLKEKYKMKKEQVKNLTENGPSINMDVLMKDISVIEKELIDEMFHQLKSVYESEIENMRLSESRKLKKTLIAHAMFLQQKRNELEAAYEKRRETLENDINQKKKFLWGLAQSLRKQNAAVVHAMKIVKEKASALNDQEDKLQNQLKDAEKILEKRSEDIRVQITNELTVLENYLETVKQEKSSVSEARFKLQNFKRICEDNTSLKTDIDSQNSKEALSERYKALKNELLNLRDKIENTKSKSDVNELFNNMKDEEVFMNLDLNNQVIDERPSRGSISKVNNELKNNKNCNNPYNTEEPYSQRLSTEAIDNEAVNELKEENKRLKELSEQQREHIKKLTSSEHRLQMELLSARTSVAAVINSQHTEPFHITMQRASESVSRPSCCGEELNVIDPGRRRLTPQDDIPFITGNLHKSNPSENWRVGRHMSPVRLRSDIQNVTKNTSRPMSAGLPSNVNNITPVKEKPKKDDKGSVHRTSRQSPVRSRDISPSSVLREAKSRLRKLKIEADAVEQSYLDYKRKQTVQQDELNDEKSNQSAASKQQPFSSVLDKRYTEFETKCNLGDHFKSKNTAIQIVKPIPKQCCLVMHELQGDLVEKPLDEFRKLYKSSPPTSPLLVRKVSKSNSELNEENQALMCEITQRKSSDNNRDKSQEESKQEVLSEKTHATQRNVEQEKNYYQGSTDYSIGPKEDEIDFKDLIAIDMPKHFRQNDIVYVESTTCNDDNTTFSKDVPSLDTPTPSVNTFENINSNRDGGDQNYEMNTMENRQSVSNETLKDAMMRPGMPIMATPEFDNDSNSQNNNDNSPEKDDQMHGIYKDGNRNNISSNFIQDNANVFDSFHSDKDIIHCSDLSDMNIDGVFDSVDTTKNSSVDMIRKSDEESFWD